MLVGGGGVTGQHQGIGMLSPIGYLGDRYFRLRKLLLSVTAMPTIGNSHTDDPVCASVTGSTCTLRIGVYCSGCLHDQVPLRGEGTSDRLPVDVSGNSGQGSVLASVGSTSGLASGPSESAGMGCSWLDISSGHNIGSVSTSGLLANPMNDFCSGPGVKSDGVSNTAG